MKTLWYFARIQSVESGKQYSLQVPISEDEIENLLYKVGDSAFESGLTTSRADTAILQLNRL